MASNARQEGLGYADRGLANPDTSAAEAALKTRLNRKRTKTGCLTCRKRRIKCGEERPVCKNCIKSKRQCEGYNQRVVFKQPTFDYQPLPNGGPHITFQGAPDGGPLVPYDEGYRQVVVDPGFYTQQQSVPAAQYPPVYPGFEQRQQHHNVATPIHPLDGLSYHAPSTGQPHIAYHQMVNGAPAPIQRGQGVHSGDIYSAQTQIFIQPLNYPLPSTLPPPPPALSIPNSAASQTQPGWQTPYSGDHEQQWPVESPDVKPSFDRVSPISGVSPKTTNWNQALTPGILSQEPDARTYVPRPELARPIGIPASTAATTIVSEAITAPTAPILPQTQSPPEFYEYTQPLPAAHTTNHLLSQAAVETQDDDYYDVDEEMDIDTWAVATLDHRRQQSLQRILQVNNISVEDLQTRRYDTFLYDGILDHYRVEDAANPLKNPATARVFAHFIAVTAPSLSIFERHPRNTSVLFSDRQIPFSQQGLWTYTMPVAALHHQGLLHSMLALASLHIARLQNASDTPSRQHYAWACKRINNLLGPNSKKRHKTTTIAASMLLGFYEIFTADHRAWNLHLTGSKQLFLETDFLSMSRQLRRMKREKSIRQQVKAEPDAAWANIHPQDEMLDQIHDVDEKIISHLVGKPVTYEDDTQLMTPQSAIPPALDLTNFEILRDLYWWYLKQDAYQSIISGNPLLLDYDRWANCPPRAPVGRADAVYGSFDHLILLLGRIAEFAVRDRKRKLRQMDANGGQWKPAPGLQMGQKPPAGRSQPNTPLSAHNGQPQGGSYFTGPPQQPPAPTAPQQPMFYGMAPAPRQDVQMPSAYYPTNSMPTPQPTSPKEEIDLRAATNAALEEYGRIRAALLEFEHSLGKDFQPIPAEYQVPVETPFGTALTYRSYDISCLWAIYYMCMIITIRSHPHMHPAAHVAAGIAAQETAHYANEIGRINAGIVPGPTDDVPLNPTLGAALWESCITSFFAAIQYRDPHQRRTTVLRIHNIGVRTGWGTAETIANGCETAWVKAAAAGRGPPYTRIARREYSDDPRLSGSADELDPNGVPNEKDNFDRRLVKTATDARLTWAIGILGSEEDERTKVMA